MLVYNVYTYIDPIHPSIHCSMGPAPVGVQYPLTSLLGEFPGYLGTCSGMGFRSYWCSSPFPSPSIYMYVGVFLFTLLHLPLNFSRVSSLQTDVSAHIGRPLT